MTDASQQPSPDYLASLGIKVRDFAYENTLPAIVPVPRVPRQMQPAPKRPRGDTDTDTTATPSKKPRPLERMPTEPLQEPAVQHTRTFRRVCSIIIPPSPISPCTRRFSASPPTSPLLSAPLVLHVDDTTLVESQPALYAAFTLDSPVPDSQGAELAPPARELGAADPRIPKRCTRGVAPAPNRYHLRKRPLPPIPPSAPSRRSSGTSTPLSRLTRTMR